MQNPLKNVLQALHHLDQTLVKRLAGGVDRLLDGGSRPTDFTPAPSAEWEDAEQRLRAGRLIIWLSAFVVLVFVLWSALTQLDEVTRAEGKVVPSHQPQLISSPDGGALVDVKVQEGQSVKAGDVLLVLDQARFTAALKENRGQQAALQARLARLNALASGKPFSVAPEVQKDAPEAVEQERQAFEAKRQEIGSALNVARQQLSLRRMELGEATARRDQVNQHYTNATRELENARSQVRSGSMNESELLRFEREMSRYQGEKDAANAQLPRIQAAISEAQRRIDEVEQNLRNQAKAELAELTAKLAPPATPGDTAAPPQNLREIKAPTHGTVKRIMAGSPGSAIEPGKEVVEIIPSDEAMLLEARVQARDVAFLRPGQPVLVKFTAYDFSIYGGLEATLEQIGSEAGSDDKGGAYYLIRVRTRQNHIGDARLPISPGMVAEVDILTGKKSLLDYLLKPILRAKNRALTER